eukprot:749773-Hanusia_phi.AAC.10
MEQISGCELSSKIYILCHQPPEHLCSSSNRFPFHDAPIPGGWLMLKQATRVVLLCAPQMKKLGEKVSRDLPTG